MALNLEDYVSSIPDFPKEGILFRDVTSIIQDGEAFRETINQLVAFAKSVNADFIVGPEARGFIFGAPKWESDLHRSESLENFQEKPFPVSMIWNTAPMKYACIRMRSSQGQELLS